MVPAVAGVEHLDMTPEPGECPATVELEAATVPVMERWVHTLKGMAIDKVVTAVMAEAMVAGAAEQAEAKAALAAAVPMGPLSWNGKEGRTCVFY